MSDEPAKAIASRLVCGGLLDPSQRSVDANTSIISDKLASLTTELAASRARETKMREALEYCVESTFSHWTIARDVARAALSASEAKQIEEIGDV